MRALTEVVRVLTKDYAGTDREPIGPMGPSGLISRGGRCENLGRRAAVHPRPGPRGWLAVFGTDDVLQSDWQVAGSGTFPLFVLVCQFLYEDFISFNGPL